MRRATSARRVEREDRRGAALAGVSRAIWRIHLDDSVAGRGDDRRRARQHRTGDGFGVDGVGLAVQQDLDIREYTDTHHDASVPHTLVLAPGLVVDKIYCGYWFWGRPSIYDLWADLRDLLRRTRPDFDPLLPEIREAYLAAAR